MVVKMGPLVKAAFSFLILALFIYGMGLDSFFPPLKILADTQWDFSLFPSIWGKKLVVLFWVIPLGFGFLGWARALAGLFFQRLDPAVGRWMGLALSLSLFSLYVFGLAINGILFKPLVLLFFLPMLLPGWKSLRWKDFSREGWIFPPWAAGLLIIPLFFWFLEYLSPPLIWDAVLDHYRYAREVARLHQIPLYWANHTGDMPKAAELILAGFWSVGGEDLSKISSALAALFTSGVLWLFSRDWNAGKNVTGWLFWTCPFFLAIFSWGYVEGFLALYEVLALYCLWKGLRDSHERRWIYLTAFFLGFSFAVKYTAVLAAAPLFLVLVFEKFVKKTPVRMDGWCLLLLASPGFPWLLKNILAFGNPFYPLALSWFGAPVGYTAQMGAELLRDTGMPVSHGFTGILRAFWNSFFTPLNGVRAAWTPLAAMGLPWLWKALKTKFGIYLFSFSVVFFLGWALCCTGLRHAAGGTLALTLLAGLAWSEGLKFGGKAARAAFGAGIFLSFWLLLSAQSTSTVPYAAALGMEDPLGRLRRNYSYSSSVYEAYRAIEAHSDPHDKVIAFAVFQTYPLANTAYVDFLWKKPVFLEWASSCKTAEQLAGRLKKEGAAYFLYQKWEAHAMSSREKDFRLEGIPVPEYARFWRYFMEPVADYGNVLVYRARDKALDVPENPRRIPGLNDGDPL